MTTKTISTYVAAGYSLASKYSELYISSTGGVGGTGVYAVAAASIVNYGRITASPNHVAIDLNAGGSILNGSYLFETALTSGRKVVVKGAAGTIRNFGTIHSAVYLYKGGAITNGGAADTTAQINLVGVLIEGAAGSVTNFGTIAGSGGGYVAVNLGAGGDVVNGAVTDTHALIEGGDGVVITSSASITNLGTIDGVNAAPGGYGVLQHNGGYLTNGARSDRIAAIEGYTGVSILGSPGSVINFGSIDGLGTKVGARGVYMKYGGRLINGSAHDAAAEISGLDGVWLQGAGTVVNYGSIEANGALGSSGVFLAAGGSVINDGAVSGYDGIEISGGGYIDNSGLVSGDNGVGIGGGSGTIMNGGTILQSFGFSGAYLSDGGLVQNGDGPGDSAALIKSTLWGVDCSYAGTSVVNYGSIIGGSRYDDAYGVHMINGGVVTNGTNSDRAAAIEGYTGVSVLGALGSVANFGRIDGFGTKADARGVYMKYGGRLTNGSPRDAVAEISGFTGVWLQGAGTVVNDGSIQADAGDGVYLAAGGAVMNYGAISGYDGVEISNGGLLRNSGLVTGDNGVVLGGGIGTVINSGTILQSFGFDAVYLTDGGLVQNGGGPADTGALISTTLWGVHCSNAAANVVNYGSIIVTLAGIDSYGVLLDAGGRLTNGAATDRLAAISGATAVSILESPGSVTNYGAIEGFGSGADGRGVYMSLGGVLGNGAGALVQGATGVRMVGAGIVTNGGSIVGLAGSGVSLGDGGSLVNGSATNRAALVEGASAVAIYAAAGTLANYGSIVGLGAAYSALYLNDGGKVTNGSVNDAAAVIEGGAGVNALGAALTLANFGTVQGLGGAGTFGLSIGSGAGATIANGSAGDSAAVIEGYLGVQALGAATGVTLTNFGTIRGAAGTAVELSSATDTLAVQAGSAFVGAVLGGGGTLALNLSGTVTALGGGSVTLAGTGAPTTFSNFGTVVTALGAQVTVTGAVTLAAGQALFGDGALTVSNSVASAGLIDAGGGGSVTISGALANSGTIGALAALLAGTLSVDGAVTGNGAATIGGGLLSFGSTFAENVAFTGTTGQLRLARSQVYTGSISGFSRSGGTSLDLLDIGFVSSTEASFSGTTRSGVLTVTDGVHTALINLKGNFTTSTFIASSDGHGGTVVIDPRQTTADAPASAPPAPLFVAAMAGLAAAPGASVHARDVGTAPEDALARPRI